MTAVLPTSRAMGHGVGAAVTVLALLLAGSAGAQTASGRKTMEFDVVPAAPRPAPQQPDAAAAPVPDQAGAATAGAPATSSEAASSGAATAQSTAPQTIAPQTIAPQGSTAQVPTSQSATSQGTPAQGAPAQGAPAQGAAPQDGVAQTPQPAAPAATAQGAAPAMPSVQAGLLECRGEFATGYGFGSSRAVRCEFRPTLGVVQFYVGKLDRVGLDIGVSDQASLLWGVLATSRDLKPGALAGRYSGISSGFALGPGFSANMLASEDATRQITLQPLSVSSDSGLSLSITGATLTLEPSAKRPR